MEVLANNVANANTTAYKSQQVSFETYVSEPKFGDKINFVVNRATLRNTTPGSTVNTGNELDMALQGKGYFAVRTPQGVQYTRAGSFVLDNDGNIVTQDGNQVLSAGGQALNIPNDASALHVDQTGRITTDKGEVGQLQVVNFAHEQDMVETGHNLYQASEKATPATDTKVAQGMIEQSNVNAVVEMTKVTEVVRAYQQTQTLLQNENDRIRNAVRVLGRVMA